MPARKWQRTLATSITRQFSVRIHPEKGEASMTAPANTQPKRIGRARSERENQCESKINVAG